MCQAMSTQETEFRDFPLLVELAQREEMVLNGKLAVGGALFLETRSEQPLRRSSS